MGTVFNLRESTVERILMGPPNNTYKGFQEWLETKYANGVLTLQQLEAISNEDMSPTSGPAVNFLQSSDSKETLSDRDIRRRRRRRDKRHWRHHCSAHGHRHSYPQVLASPFISCVPTPDKRDIRKIKKGKYVILDTPLPPLDDETVRLKPLLYIQCNYIGFPNRSL